MPKCDFNKVALQQPLHQKTSGRLLLKTFSENEDKTVFLLASKLNKQICILIDHARSSIILYSKSSYYFKSKKVHWSR